ncbi:MAG: hypothetical protein ACP5MU_01465 [Thermoplasmata archaeon]
MNSITFLPMTGYITVIKSHHPNYIPDKLRGQVFGNSSHIGAGIFRDSSGWFIHMNSFVDIPNEDIQTILRTMNSGYEDLKDRPYASTDGKFLRRTISNFSSKILDKLSEIEFLTIQPVSLIGNGETIIAINYPESALQSVSNTILKAVSGSSVPMEVICHRSLENGSIPFLFIYHNLVAFDYSRLAIVKTSWKITEDNIPKDIDTSEDIYFNPAVYDSSIDKFVAFKAGKFFYMPIPNQWIKTFKDYSLLSVGGAIYYWGRVKGNDVEEYYIFNKKFVNIFLSSLSLLWKHSPWKLGNPHIKYINNLQLVKEEMGF